MKIAITGGIGSGKSYVCRILEKQGIRVYDCDDEAKRLMRTDARLQAGLKKLVGDQVYSAEGVLQKPVLAQFLLAGEANKQAVNDVVHPAVARDFEQSSYEWMESAILFDSGFYRRIHLDFVVCVTAPVPVRIQRIMQRDHIPAEKAQQWIDAVMPQEELAARSDFEIVNDGEQNIEAQVRNLIVETLDETHKRIPAFATDRVTSLGDIAMYTDADEVPLWEVLDSVSKKEEGKPSTFNYKKAPVAELHAYFAEVLPNYDRDRVHDSDIKKLLQWYNILAKYGITDFKATLAPTEGENVDDRAEQVAE